MTNCRVTIAFLRLAILFVILVALVVVIPIVGAFQSGRTGWGIGLTALWAVMLVVRGWSFVEFIVGCTRALFRGGPWPTLIVPDGAGVYIFACPECGLTVHGIDEDEDECVGCCPGCAAPEVYAGWEETITEVRAAHRLGSRIGRSAFLACVIVLIIGVYAGTLIVINLRGIERYRQVQIGELTDIAPMALTDGGSLEYRGFGYRVTHVHRQAPPDEWQDGQPTVFAGYELEYTCRGWFPLAQRLLRDKQEIHGPMTAEQARRY